MKNDHQYFLDMCCRVKRFYRRNETELDKIKNMTALMVKLNAMTSVLSVEFENSITYFQGYSIANARKRENLQNQCKSFAEHVRKVIDQMKYNTSKELKHFILLDEVELNVLDDEEIIDYASALYDLCSNIESRLKLQGVYTKALETFAKTLTLFALEYPSNQLSVEKRKRANLQTLKAIADINDLFEMKLDNAMAALQHSNPVLYSEYFKTREIVPHDLSREPDYTGTVKGQGVYNIAELKYDRHREFLVLADGGNVLWGLSNRKDHIEYGRPLNETSKLRISSRIIAHEGNYLNIQAVDPDSEIHFRVWVY